jgi:hypothetical protein
MGTSAREPVSEILGRVIVKAGINPDSAVNNYDIEEAEKKDSGSECLG